MTEYYEDLEEGDVYELGSVSVSRDELLEFATRYDPQPIHVDEDAAKDSMFGGLIASGIHTLALQSSLVAREFFSVVPNLGGRGLDDVRWHQPVRPGDELSVRVTIGEKSLPDPDRSGGYVDLEIETLNQDDEVVLTTTSRQIIERADP